MMALQMSECGCLVIAISQFFIFKFFIISHRMSKVSLKMTRRWIEIDCLATCCGTFMSIKIKVFLSHTLFFDLGFVLFVTLHGTSLTHGHQSCCQKCDVRWNIEMDHIQMITWLENFHFHIPPIYVLACVYNGICN